MDHLESIVLMCQTDTSITIQTSNISVQMNLTIIPTVKQPFLAHTSYKKHFVTHIGCVDSLNFDNVKI